MIQVRALHSIGNHISPIVNSVDVPDSRFSSESGRDYQSTDDGAGHGEANNDGAFDT